MAAGGSGPPRSRALRRACFTFAADGSHAACLAASADGGWQPETWCLHDGAPAAVALPGPRPESPHSQLLALCDGRVLVCRHAEARHELSLRGPTGAEAEHPAGVLASPGLRMVAMPPVRPGGGPAPGAPLALALATDTRPVTTAWLVFGGGREPRAVAQVPGIFGGGSWLDPEGRLLALDRLSAGRVKTVVLDLARSAVSPLLEITPESNDRLALADPESGLLLVRSDAPGTDRLGWGVLGDGAPVRFPECLNQAGVLLRPLAVEPPAGRTAAGAEGPRVVLQRDRGAASGLAVWRPGSRPRPLPVPPGRLGGVAHWSASGLHVPYSAPDRPPALARVEVDRLLASDPDRPAPPARPLPPRPSALQVPAGARPGVGLPVAPPRAGALAACGAPEDGRPAREPVGPGPGWRLHGSAPAPEGGRWHPARLVELAGAAGPVEAVVYGGDAWPAASHLVLALHDGPADAWRLEFDPALQRMAAEGLAVVAPNYRGSTGYGPAHADAVRGAWGGPDLADVLVLLDGLAGRRAELGLEPPALFGVSYGAFLALLATAAAADQVARCAVVAPFLSGPRLLAEASDPVRSLVTRLGGTREVRDARGARDVLEVCHRLAAPLLVVHGDQDAVVPVAHSRALRRELLRIGRVEGTDFRCVEAAGAGHELLAEPGAAVLHELLAVFLRTGRPS